MCPLYLYGYDTISAFHPHHSSSQSGRLVGPHRQHTTRDGVDVRCAPRRRCDVATAAFSSAARWLLHPEPPTGAVAKLVRLRCLFLLPKTRPGFSTTDAAHSRSMSPSPSPFHRHQTTTIAPAPSCSRVESGSTERHRRIATTSSIAAGIASLWSWARTKRGRGKGRRNGSSEASPCRDILSATSLGA